MTKLEFQIEKHLGVLSEAKSGWTKEVNLVSWNDRPAKLDIREWDVDHQKMSKGITFTKEELELLKQILDDYL